MTDKRPASSAAAGVSEPEEDAKPAASRGPSAAALWVEAFRAVANLVAHDFRNSLNAVAVNLEVVRSRSARGAESSAIAPFAATAATHFEVAAASAEALMAFARPEPVPVDVSAVTVRLSRVLAVGAQSTLQVLDRTAGRAKTAADGDIVRAAVARSVLAALIAGDTVLACEIAADDGIFLSVTGATRIPPLPDSELVTAAATHGIRISTRGQSLELRFPAVD